MTPEETIEAAARAVINRRKMPPEYGDMDAFDLLKSWAYFDKSKAKTGTIGYRANPDSLAASAKELSGVLLDAETALSTLRPGSFLPGGLVVVPEDLVEKMKTALRFIEDAQRLDFNEDRTLMWVVHFVADARAMLSALEGK